MYINLRVVNALSILVTLGTACLQFPCQAQTVPDEKAVTILCEEYKKKNPDTGNLVFTNIEIKNKTYVAHCVFENIHVSFDSEGKRLSL